MIYDVSHEIRSTMKIFIKEFLEDTKLSFKNLLSKQYNHVYSATKFLKISVCPDAVFNLFKILFETFIYSVDFKENIKNTEFNFLREVKRINIFGCLYCLIQMNFINENMNTMVSKLFYTYRDLQGNNDWKIVKECCYYFYQQNNHDILLLTLLSTNQLGLILTLRNLIDPNRIENIESFVDIGIDYISKKNVNCRKSGGISFFFKTILQRKELYRNLKYKLLSIMFEFTTNKNYYKSHYKGLYKFQKIILIKILKIRDSIWSKLIVTLKSIHRKWKPVVPIILKPKTLIFLN